MEQKSNKWLITLILILTLCIIGLIVYILFDKNNNKKEINEKTTTQLTTTQIVNDKKELIEFPNNDESVISLVQLSYFESSCFLENCKFIDKGDNKNFEINYNDIKIDYKCLNFDFFEAYDDVERKFCFESEIILDENIRFNVTDNWERGDKSTLIMKTDKYYFIQHMNLDHGNGKIVIYDYNGKLIKEILKTVVDFVLEETDEYFYDEYYFKLNDSKLYYVSSDDYFEYNPKLEKYNYVHFNYIDLDNDFNIVELSKEKAGTRQQA